MSMRFACLSATTLLASGCAIFAGLNKPTTNAASVKAAIQQKDKATLTSVCSGQVEPKMPHPSYVGQEVKDVQAVREACEGLVAIAKAERDLQFLDASCRHTPPFADGLKEGGVAYHEMMFSAACSAAASLKFAETGACAELPSEWSAFAKGLHGDNSMPFEQRKAFLVKAGRRALGCKDARTLFLGVLSIGNAQENSLGLQALSEIEDGKPELFALFKTWIASETGVTFIKQQDTGLDDGHWAAAANTYMWLRDRHATEACALYGKALVDETDAVRQTAVSYLKHARCPEMIKAAAFQLASPKPDYRITACQVLAPMATPDVATQIKTVAATDPFEEEVTLADGRLMRRKTVRMECAEAAKLLRR